MKATRRNPAAASNSGGKASWPIPAARSSGVAPVDQPATQVVSLDLAQLDVVRTHWPFLRDRRIDAYGDITRRYIDE